MVERVNSPGWGTYLRVSDEDKQSPERSFAMQRQRIQEQLLQKSGVPFKQEYRDLLSGTTTNLADYQQMLSDAQSGMFSHLGLYRADRFGRNTVEGLQAANRLMAMGIKLRVASMPSLRHEEPDGFFMFLIQMGMAQREVDVMRQRTRDGTEAKLRAGGWSHRAPAGYVNKERHLKSGKYERWVEKNPEYNHVVREAWDLLLPDQFTLEQICEELNRRCYVRPSGKPWAWNTPKRGTRRTAKSNIQHMFHNPFYAGWVVSEGYKIKYGEVRGKWEPTVSTKEYERGISILRKHDYEKIRTTRNFYLLRNLLWVETEGRRYKLYGSTPTGRSQVYRYYITHAKTKRGIIRFPIEKVDNQVHDWIGGIVVDQDIVPAIRDTNKTHIKQVTQEGRGEKLSKLKETVSKLQQEEAHLTRLAIMKKISEDTFEMLHSEWKEKLRNNQLNLEEMEQETTFHLDDLDVGLFLLLKLKDLYGRLEQEKKKVLLRILAKRIIVNPEGEMIQPELNAPFTYLKSLVDDFSTNNHTKRGSCFVQLGPSHSIRTSSVSLDQFLASVRFENRSKLDQLNIDFDTLKPCLGD